SVRARGQRCVVGSPSVEPHLTNTTKSRTLNRRSMSRVARASRLWLRRASRSALVLAARRRRNSQPETAALPRRGLAARATDRVRGNLRPNPVWVASLAIILVFIAGPAPGLDWPQWRGPNRDGNSQET